MGLKNYWNLLTKRNKFIKPAKFTKQNLKAVIQAQQRKIEMNGFSLPIHQYEQIVWRRTQVMRINPECWDSGSCKVCGCDILGKTMEDRPCSAIEVRDVPVCYPAMMDETVWKEYKIIHKIKLFE
jgi:hypothetical protein